MNFVTKAAGETRIVCPEGRLDIAAAAELEKALADAVSSGTSRLLLDLERVDFMGSSALRSLLNARKAHQKCGGELALCSPAPEVRRILTLSGFTTIFKVFSSEEQALSEDWTESREGKGAS